MPNFDWSKTIFPLLAAKSDPSVEPSAPHFIGTSFFSTIGGYPFLFTARHVIDPYKDSLIKRETDLFIATPYGKQRVIKLAGAIVEHKFVDVCAYLIVGDVYTKHQTDFVPIDIDFTDLQLGTEVLSFGFPESGPVYDDGTKQKILEVHYYCFKGYISNIEDGSWLGGTRKTYKVNFPGMPGLSGAPLMLPKEGRLVCCGIMMGEVKIAQLYSFGIVCDASPLLEFKGILDDFNKGLRTDDQIPK